MIQRVNQSITLTDNVIVKKKKSHCLTSLLLSLFAYRNIHNLLVFGEAGIVDPSLQLFPVSSEKPPTPLECLVCALWSLILIIKLSLQHESWAASSGTLGSSALNQSNQVLHWRTFSPLFFQSGHLDSPLTHFHNYACPVIDGVKNSLPLEGPQNQLGTFYCYDLRP